ncbi:MAG: D-alanyl-D-alanine carboxypeptidase family protein [Pseudomonadota bacterium]
MAAPYAAMVIDARSGEVLHSRNADTRLHPASLTKMMTLYIAFEAVEHGEISLDTKVRISKKAAAEPPSKLGLKAGQRISLRYLIRAAAVKSANDAATAIAEAISGSEAAFARRMNRTAKAMGMTRTTFKNAHGLTEQGHMSTARDMTTMGRHLFYDFPEYYNIFKRTSTDAGIATVRNTNRRLLSNYQGADGIKTGYTRAAGFNLVASARRGQERIIATVFGGRSTATRNARVAELLDMGFRRAPSRVAERKPVPPAYNPDGAPGAAGKTIRTVVAVAKSIRPMPRRGTEPASDVLVAMRTDIDEALALIDIENSRTTPIIETNAAGAPVIPNRAPRPRPAEAIITSSAVQAAPRATQDAEVVTRMSTSGGSHWGITVGRFGSRHQAERVLLQTALLELGTLDEALRKVVPRSGGYEASFLGMSAEQADLACRRLSARNVDCAPIGP